MCIRDRDGGGGSMTGSFDLPDENEFDHDMQLILTRKQTKDAVSYTHLTELLSVIAVLSAWMKTLSHTM